MLSSLIHPKSFFAQTLYHGLVSLLVIGLIGCSAPPRVEKPPTSVARAMETRPFQGDLKTVLKASINSLQDMDYTIEVLNSDVGLITASRTTESKKAGLSREGQNNQMTDAQKACLAIGAIAIIAMIAASIFEDSDSDSSGSGNIFSGGSNDDGPDGPMIYRYKVTINLTELKDSETKVRVSASGEVEQDGKILSTGGVHEPEFFQKFFSGMNQGLFLDQNQ